MAWLTCSLFKNSVGVCCVDAQLSWVMLLWSVGLLLCLSTFCTCLDEECILGIVGHPVLLPCYLPNPPFSLHNLSVEWRRGSELVLKAEWHEDGDVALWSLNRAHIITNAPLTGNFSLELPKVNPKEEKMIYSLFFTSSDNGSVPLCSQCLKTAARFSLPLLHRDKADDNRTVFLCHSSGGFPEPTVYWLINDTEQPPEGSVWTDAAPLSDSNLYNVTSQLTVNISTEDSVSCHIQNQWMNETLISKSSAKDDTFRSRASDGMWMFSTGLCVAVGILVAVGVGYQIHLDRISKKRRVLYESTRAQRGHKKKHQFIEVTEEETLTAKESCV